MAASAFSTRPGVSVTIYGIKNCDTMKKAFAWLDKAGVAYEFHDYKKAGVAKGDLEKWCKAAGWETVLNRAGTTVNKLPDADKDALTERKAIALMMAQPSLIKRPVLDDGIRLLVGFKPDDYEKQLGGKTARKKAARCGAPQVGLNSLPEPIRTRSCRAERFVAAA